MNYRSNVWLQTAFITLCGVALSAALYSDWFQTCCMDFSRTVIGILTMPAILIAMIIGNGVHNATSTDFTIGLVGELLIIWVLVRLILKAKAKRDAAGT